MFIYKNKRLYLHEERAMLTEVNEVKLLGLLRAVRVVAVDGARAYTGCLHTDNGRYGCHSITIPHDVRIGPAARARLERAAACGDELWAFIEGSLRSAPERLPAAPAPTTVLVRRIRLLYASALAADDRGQE
jgi:hypothetical protein